MKTLKKFSLLVILVHSLSLFRPKNTKMGGGEIKYIKVFLSFYSLLLLKKNEKKLVNIKTVCIFASINGKAHHRPRGQKQSKKMNAKIYRGNASELIALPEINHYISRFGEIVVKSGKELLELPTRRINKKYRVISINGNQYYIHKLVWKYVRGGEYGESIEPQDGNHENFDASNWQLRKGGMGRPKINDPWEMRKEYIDGAKVADIAAKHGTSLSYATLICSGFKELPEWLSIR